MSRLKIKLQRWADESLLFWFAIWAIGVFALSLIPKEYVIAITLVGVTAWYHKQRSHNTKIDDMRYFLKQISDGVRKCDLCGSEVKFPYDMLFSRAVGMLFEKLPLACQACLDQYGGSIPIDVGLTAIQRREGFLRKMGFSLLGERPTIIPGDSKRY